MSQDHYSLFSLIQSLMITVVLVLYLKPNNILDIIGYIFFTWLVLMIVNPLSLSAYKEIKEWKIFKKKKP